MKCQIRIFLIAATLLFSCKEDDEDWSVNIISSFDGQLLKNGSSVSITWKSNFNSDFGIDLLKDDVYHSTIVDQVNGSSYIWDVEGLSAGNTFSVAIRIAEKPEVADTSSYFEVLPKIPFTSAVFISEDLAIDDKIIRLYTAGEGEVTILFEHGLGGSSEVWFENKLLHALAENNQVIAYNRSGYPPSTHNGETRGLVNITKDLDRIIDEKVGGKLILVGFSYGGATTRYYAVHNSAKVDALMFIDPVHESASNISQTNEDNWVRAAQESGNYGMEIESTQWVETFELLMNLGTLPNIPVVVLTAPPSGSRRFNAHMELGAGVSDFTHISSNSGHAVQVEEPELVYKYLLELIDKM